jgi:hypothetical protein
MPSLEQWEQDLLRREREWERPKKMPFNKWFPLMCVVAGAIWGVVLWFVFR